MCGAKLVICTFIKLVDRVVSIIAFLTGRAFEYNLAHRVSVTVLSVLFMIRRNPMKPLGSAFLLPNLPVRVARRALSLIDTRMHHLAAKTRGTARLSCPSSYLYGTISVTLWSMVCGWWVFRAAAHSHFVFHYFLFSFLLWVGSLF